MRSILSRDYDPIHDVEVLTKHLNSIMGLREVVKSPAFEKVRAKFTTMIEHFTEDVFELCENPVMNEMEIICKRLVASALSSILISLKTDIEGIPRLRKQLDEKLKEAQAIHVQEKK